MGWTPFTMSLNLESLKSSKVKPLLQPFENNDILPYNKTRKHSRVQASAKADHYFELQAKVLSLEIL